MMRNYTIISAGILILAGAAGGGYFLWVSAAAAAFLLGVGLVHLWKRGRLCLACDWNLLALGAGTAGSLLNVCWAVDPGMAVMGVLKFLPVFLYFVLLCQEPKQREKLIGILPLTGSLMTITSMIMMQFPIFEKYVSVAGRLAGFFQYPNTYALFLLVCMIISAYEIIQKQSLWLSAGNITVALFGIIMSGSRAVFVLTGMTMLVLIILQKKLKRVFLLAAVLCLLITAGAAATAGGGSVQRLFKISLHSSTLLGRLLYARDALPLILRHPFGIGYYGYYFMQQEIQTGVYSVVNVHNELLQFMLDVGIIPALLLYGCVLKSILSTETCARNRLVLTVLFLHSLFDYDFQFLSMCLVLLLFLDIRNVKEMKIFGFSKLVFSIAAVVLIVSAAVLGASEFCYSRGRYEQALEWYPKNTIAKTALLAEAETAEEMEQLADSILQRNSHVAGAYSARARAAFAKGDMERFIQDKLTAIRLAPYQFEEYLDYLDTLFLAMDQYMENREPKSAKMCLKRAKAVPDLLQKTAEKTSRLGWEIQDQPQAELPSEYLEKLEKCEKILQ